MTAVSRTIGRALATFRGATALVGAPIRGRGAVVFTYHDVIDDLADTSDQVTAGALRADLLAAQRWGLRWVGLPELATRFFAGDRLDGLAAVTFDDALIGVHRHAVGILGELGVPATVFAVSQRLGTGKPEWYAGSNRVMTPDELREVADAGLTVQSHTRTHADLPAITDPEALRGELAGARTDLEQLLGRPVEYVAYPYGYFDRRVRDAAEAAGYRAAFMFIAGRIVPGLDPFRLPRLPMWSRHRRSRLAYLLARPASSFRDFQPDTVTA
jgi:peptidoglycan/xylan/chitin deacetylase (PgdA/CDA1 family)